MLPELMCLGRGGWRSSKQVLNFQAHDFVFCKKESLLLDQCHSRLTIEILPSVVEVFDQTSVLNVSSSRLETTSFPNLILRNQNLIIWQRDDYSTKECQLIKVYKRSVKKMFYSVRNSCTELIRCWTTRFGHQRLECSETIVDKLFKRLWKFRNY